MKFKRASYDDGKIAKEFLRKVLSEQPHTVYRNGRKVLIYPQLMRIMDGADVHSSALTVELVHDIVQDTYFKLASGEMVVSGIPAISDPAEHKVAVINYIIAFIRASLSCLKGSNPEISLTVYEQGKDEGDENSEARPVADSRAEEAFSALTEAIDDIELERLVRLVLLLDKMKTQQGYSLLDIVLNTLELEDALADWSAEAEAAVAEYAVTEMQRRLTTDRQHAEKGQCVRITQKGIKTVRDFSLCGFELKSRQSAENMAMLRRLCTNLEISLSNNSTRGLFAKIAQLMGEVVRDKERVLRMVNNCTDGNQAELSIMLS